MGKGLVSRAKHHISFGGLPETPWYQKFISYLEIRSGTMTVWASESLLSSVYVLASLRKGEVGKVGEVGEAGS